MLVTLLLLQFFQYALCSFNINDIIGGVNVYIGYGENCYLSWRYGSSWRKNAEFLCGDEAYIINNPDRFKMKIFSASIGSSNFVIKSGDKALYWTGTPPNAEFRDRSKGDTFLLEGIENGVYKIRYSSSCRMRFTGTGKIRNAHWECGGDDTGDALWIRRVVSEALQPFIGIKSLQIGYGKDCHMFWRKSSSTRSTAEFRCGTEKGSPIEILPISGSMKYRIKSGDKMFYWLGGYSNTHDAQFRTTGNGDTFRIDQVFPNRFRIFYNTDCSLFTRKSDTNVKNAEFECSVSLGSGDLYWIRADGGWSSWSAWSVCSRNCNSGKTVRKRTCTNPAPMHGGKNCVGINVEEKPCNNEICTEAMCELQSGDGKGSREIALNQKSSFGDCVKACLEKKKQDSHINGVTITAGTTLGGVIKECYCEVSMSDGKPPASNNYQTCKLVFKDMQCFFTPGEGVSDGKIDIGVKSSPQVCARSCYEKSKTISSINGVTIPQSITQTVSRCLCDKNYQKSNIVRDWKSCRLEVTDAICELIPGDGTGAGEILLSGKKQSKEACVKACLIKRMEDNTINGITVVEGVGGDIDKCYCEKSMSGRSYSAFYKTCKMSFQGWKCTLKPGEAVSDVSTAIGAKVIVDDCAKSCFVRSKSDHLIDGISVRLQRGSSVESCVCEKGFQRSNVNVLWKSCRIAVSVPSTMPKSEDEHVSVGMTSHKSSCKLTQIRVPKLLANKNRFDRKIVFGVVSRGCCYEPINVKLNARKEFHESATFSMNPIEEISFSDVQNISIAVEFLFGRNKIFDHSNSYIDEGKLIFEVSSRYTDMFSDVNSTVNFDCPGGVMSFAYVNRFSFKHKVKAYITSRCGDGKMMEKNITLDVEAFGYGGMETKTYKRMIKHEHCNAEFLSCINALNNKYYPSILNAHASFRKCFG